MRLSNSTRKYCDCGDRKFSKTYRVKMPERAPTRQAVLKTKRNSAAIQLIFPFFSLNWPVLPMSQQASDPAAASSPQLFVDFVRPSHKSISRKYVGTILGSNGAFRPPILLISPHYCCCCCWRWCEFDLIKKGEIPVVKPLSSSLPPVKFDWEKASFYGGCPQGWDGLICLFGVLAKKNLPFVCLRIKSLQKLLFNGIGPIESLEQHARSKPCLRTLFKKKSWKSEQNLLCT